MARNDIVRHPLPEPAQLGDIVPGGVGPQATMGFIRGHRVKRGRTQGNVSFVLVAPKYPPGQTGSEWKQLLSNYIATTSGKSKEWINSGSLMACVNFVGEKVEDPSLAGVRAIVDRRKARGTLSSDQLIDACRVILGYGVRDITGEPTSARTLAWEPLPPVRYVAPH